MNEAEKKGAGRPRTGQGKAHVDLTLSVEVIAALRAMPSGVRSQFVDEWLKQSPRIMELMKQEQR